MRTTLACSLALWVMTIPLAACPADDIGPLPSDSSEGTTPATTTMATTTATDTGSTGATGESDSGTSGSGSGGTMTGADTSASGDTTGSSQSSTGGLECEMGLDPADFSMVRGCAEPIGEAFCSEGAMHVPDGTEVMWMHDPPHSGPHYQMWESWGEHIDPVARENWVHNLEHGGIVLLHNCPGGCATELDVLRDVIAQRPGARILLTGDPELTGDRFAAISWTWVYRFDAPSLATLLCFVDQHEGHAPEDVP